MIPLAAIPWRLVGVLAAVGLVAGFIWQAHATRVELHETRVEKAAAIRERNQVAADFEAYKRTAAEDAALNKETTHALAEKLAAIDAASRRNPFVLRCQPAVAATVPAEGRAAGGTHDPAAGPGDAQALRDVGHLLADAQRECAMNAARQSALQEWEAKRAH